MTRSTTDTMFTYGAGAVHGNPSSRGTTVSRTTTKRSGAVTAAVAGAGLVAALGAQLAAPGAQAHAASSVANIPANVYETVANIPAVQYQALQQTTKAFNDSGNWWLYIPTNVVGFDQQDYEKVTAISLLLMPIPKVAAAQSDQLWMTLATFAPMTPNCTGVPGPCSDPLYMLQYGQVPMWQLLTPEGYTFPEIRNTIDPKNPYYTNADGDQVAIQPWWSGKTVHLDFFGPAKAIWATLTDDPTGTIEQGPTADQWAQAYGDFGKAVFNGLNPFVDGTYCLPCQLFGVAGAPGSLPKFALFDKYYTAFDLGQKLTDQDWSLNPANNYDPTDPERDDYVPVTNIWTKAAWDQIFTDGVASVTDSVAMIPQLPTIIPENLAAFGDQLDALSTLLARNIVTNIRGLGVATGTTVESAEDLASMIRESFVNALSAQGTTPSPGTTNTVIHKRSAARTSVTLTADEALRGARTAPETDSYSEELQNLRGTDQSAEPTADAAASNPTSAAPTRAHPALPGQETPAATPRLTEPQPVPQSGDSTPGGAPTDITATGSAASATQAPQIGSASDSPTSPTQQSAGRHRADDGSGYTGKHRADTDSPSSNNTNGSGGASSGSGGASRAAA